MGGGPGGGGSFEGLSGHLEVNGYQQVMVPGETCSILRSWVNIVGLLGISSCLI